MDEMWRVAKKSYSKLGWIFFAFSIVVTIVQSVSLVAAGAFDGTASLDLQILVSTLSLYFVGSCFLMLCSKSIPTTHIEQKKMTVGQMITAFFMCYSLMVVTNFIGMLITAFIGALKGSPVINPIAEMAMGLSMPVMLLTTVIGAPIFEELFFRKFIIDRTIKYGEVVSLMVSGFMFGLFHGNLSQFPYAFALGAFFGYIYIRTGNIIYTMILHAVINFMGSIVSSFVLKLADLDSIMTALESIEADNAGALMELLSENMSGVVAYLAYEVIVILFIVIGIILWIFHAKSFAFKPTEEQIPGGKGFFVSIINKGMIAYTILWFIMIIFATI